jgi:type II secretory pathway pseudopilin PulG
MKRGGEGLSLIEVIIAVALFSLVAAALFNLLAGSYIGLKSFSSSQGALFYAQEGAEAARSIRNQGWNNLTAGSYGLTLTGNRWQFSGSQELLDNFYTRQIIIEDIYRDNLGNLVPPVSPGAILDLHTKKIIFLVSWPVPGGVTRQINLPFFVSSWQTKSWIQTDWQAGSGQLIWNNPAQFFSDDGNIDYSDAGEIKLKETTTGLVSKTWHFDSASDYDFDPQKIEVVSSYAQLKPQIQTLTGQSVNSGFTFDTSGWSFYTWDVGSGEVTPRGNWRATGGNPSGFAEIEIPANARGDEVGGYWQQAVNVDQANLDQVSCNFDWQVTNFIAPSGAVRNFRFYVFLDSSPGLPVIGQEIWRSANQTGVTNWQSQLVDCRSRITSPGTYYFKIAVFLRVRSTTGGPVGPISGGYDNAKVSWTKNVVSYPNDKPAVNPMISFSSPAIAGWTAFNEVAIKNSGEIYYQLSNNDGANWYYWNNTSWVLASPTDYNTVSVINANINSFPAVNKKINFKAFLSSSGAEQVQLDSATISYQVPVLGNLFWGNRFLVTVLDSSFRLTSGNRRQNLRFTAQKTKSVNLVRVYVDLLNNPPTYRFGLQADNGSGRPSGTYLAYGDLRPTLSGWQTITLNQPLNLIKGQTYHLVVSWQSGQIGPNRYIALRQTSPLNNLIPYDQTPDPQANVLTSTTGGSNWQTANLQPLYQLTFQDNDSEGNPYENLGELPIYHNFFQGQNLTLTEDKEFSEISFYVRRFGSLRPLDDLYFAIDNLTDNLLVTSGILAARSAVGTTYAWQTYQFPERINLEQNKTYRLYLSSPGSGANRYYLILAPVTVGQEYFKIITFLGKSSFGEQSSDSGASWQVAEERDLNFYFGLIRPTYVPQGELISSAFNTSVPAAFDFLSWQETTPSANTDIWVQLATAPDNGGIPGIWGPWQGLTGSSSYYQSGEESLIPLTNNHNDNQFARYKIILRSDSTATPVFQEIKINYTP